MGLSSFATLQKLVPARVVKERCELCGDEVPAEHPHLIEAARHKLLCACGACALLFSGNTGRFRRVPERVEYLSDFVLPDELWEQLAIPINLAFLLHSSGADQPLAFYPSPAGATEAQLSPEVWDDLVAANPVLADFEPDVEALLVYRIGATREYYRAPIDQCYRLVGLVRAHWRGMTGGTEVWKRVNELFTQWKAASPKRR